MTAALIVEIVSTLLWLVASGGDECPTALDALLDARSVEQIRRERHMSEEERRLDRFWRGFYAAQARYYGDLDKLDWVAYYKNHGVQINTDQGNGGSSRIQFAPVVVTPRLLPGGAVLGVASKPSQPAPGEFARLGSDRPTLPMRSPEWAPVAAVSGPKWTVDLRIFEASSGPGKEVHAWSKIQNQTNDAFLASQCVVLTPRTGSVQDLLSAKSAQTVPSADPLLIGVSAQGKVTAVSPGRVRVDLTLEKNALENAGKQHLLVGGRIYRLAQQVQIGQRTKVVLQSDAAGEPTLWLELLVAEVTTTVAPTIPSPPAAPYR